MTIPGSQMRLTHGDSAKITAYCLSQNCTQYTLTDLCKQLEHVIGKPILAASLKSILGGAGIKYKTAQVTAKALGQSQLDRIEALMLDNAAKLDQLLLLWGK